MTAGVTDDVLGLRARGAYHRALSVQNGVDGGGLKVRSTGVDTLNLAARGPVRKQVWELVGDVKARAQNAAESELVEFPVTGQAFLLRPHGVRGYTYWLSSPDFELMLLRWPLRAEGFRGAAVDLPDRLAADRLHVREGRTRCARL
jgi:hypothetical protein